MAESYKPKDPAIAAAVASMVLTLQQMDMFDRIGVSDSDVLFYASISVIVLTAARAAWFKFWPESASRFWGGKPKGDPAPSAEVSDDTPPADSRGLASTQVLSGIVAGVLLVFGWMISPWITGATLAFAVLLYTPHWARRSIRYFSVPALVLALTGCAGMSGPGLESVVGRIDVTRAIQCWKQPDAASKARCLGVEVLSQGLDIALGEAAAWGEKALKAASGTGADDMSEKEIQEIADNADAALNKLGAELAAAGAE